MKLLKPILLSGLILGAGVAVNSFIRPFVMVQSGQTGALGFQNSDAAYAQFVQTNNLLNFVGGIPGMISAVLLIWIWWNPVKELYKEVEEINQ